MVGGQQAIIGVVSDVSRRVEAEYRINELVRDQHAILNNRIVGFVRLKERHFVWINSASAQIVGYAQDELIGQSTRVLFFDDESYRQFGDRAY